VANRKVSVTLELQAAQFKAETLESAKVVHTLDEKVTALDRDINKLPVDSTRAAAGLGILDEAAKKTGRDINDLGVKTDQANKKITEAGEGTKTLRSRMDELEGSLKKTGTEFARNADPGLFRKLKADSSELSGLRSTVSEMEKLGLNVKRLGLEATKAESLFGSLQAGFEGGATSPGGLGIAGIAAVPALATAGGAAVAGIGALGAGAGVASAVMGNPKAFQAAWGEAAGQIKKDFLAAGDAFVGPSMDALRSIGPTIHEWNLTAALAPAAKYVPIIVDGLERGATGLEHGIADGIKKAGPAVQALSQGMAQLGEATGDALSHIADGAEGGAQALHDTITAVSAVVEGFGLLTEGAEKAYEAINDHPFISAGFTGGLSLAASAWSKLFGDVDEGGKAIGNTLDATKNLAAIGGDALQSLDVRAANAAASLDRMNAALDRSINDMLGLSGANIAVEQGFDDLAKGIERGAGALDITNERGRQNVRIIDEQIAALEKQREETIANGDGTQAATDKANAAYNSQLSKLEQMLGKLIGNKKAVEDFINAFRDKTFTITQRVNIVTTGPVSKEGVVTGGIPLHGGYATGGIRKAATGLLVPPSDPGTVLFGEPQTGGEALIPLKGISPDRAMDLAQTVGNSYGFDAVPRGWMAHSASPAGPTTINVTLAVAPGGDTAVGSMLNGLIRNGYVVVKASQVRSG
jgi:hypothetical protein